jgi:protein-S-isoprenylcysteine O-methyltransferase Ste14
MNAAYLNLVVLFLLSLSIRSSYELLKDTGKINPESKPLFAFIFLVMCALWICWFTLCPLDPFKVDLPETVRWTGFVLFMAGMGLAFGALFQLRGLENISHLVTSGLFSRLRHPMYTGFILWIVGWSIFHNAVVSLLIGVMGIANVLFWRQLEEKRLLVCYGDTYRHYRLTTWF